MVVAAIVTGPGYRSVFHCILDLQRGYHTLWVVVVAAIVAVPDCKVVHSPWGAVTVYCMQDYRMVEVLKTEVGAVVLHTLDSGRG